MKTPLEKTNRVLAIFSAALCILLSGCDQSNQTPDQPFFNRTAQEPILDPERLCTDYLSIREEIFQWHYYSPLIYGSAGRIAQKADYIRKAHQLLWRRVKEAFPSIALFEKRILLEMDRSESSDCSAEQLIYETVNSEIANGRTRATGNFDFSVILVNGIRAQLAALDSNSKFELTLSSAASLNRELSYGLILNETEDYWFVPSRESVTIAGMDSAWPEAWGRPLHMGDEVIAVDGKPVREWPFAELKKQLYQPKGATTDIRLTVHRENGDSVITLSPRVFRERSGLTATILDTRTGIGYIRIKDFLKIRTEVGFYNSLKIFNQNRIRVLILDLRECLGGIVGSVLNIFNLFDKTRTFLFTSQLHELGQVSLMPYNTAPDPANPDQNGRKFQYLYPQERFDTPVIILVDSWTASAAEILAKLLQLYDHAVVIGSPTFGKATKQDVFPTRKMINMDGLKTRHPLDGSLFITDTVFYYYREKSAGAESEAQTHQLVGIKPNVFLKNSEVESLRAKYRAAHPNEFISEATYENPVDPSKLPPVNMSTPKLSLQAAISSAPAEATPEFKSLRTYLETFNGAEIDSSTCLDRTARQLGFEDRSLCLVYRLLTDYQQNSK